MTLDSPLALSRQGLMVTETKDWNIKWSLGKIGLLFPLLFFFERKEKKNRGNKWPTLSKPKTKEKESLGENR